MAELDPWLAVLVPWMLGLSMYPHAQGEWSEWASVPDAPDS